MLFKKLQSHRTSGQQWSRFGILAIYYGLAAVLAVLLFTSSAQRVSAASTITGKVYRDYNANATTDAREPGVGGVVVTAYDATGASVGTATTATDGTYTLTISGSATLVRVEFTSVPTGFQPSAAGGSKTTVQFVTAPATGVDLGINRPSQYCQANPTLSTSCFILGDPSTAASFKTVVSFPYGSTGRTSDATYVAPTSLANPTQIGATYGMAWQPSSKSMFVGAYQKRNTGYGPAGTGGIYRIIPGTTPTVSTFLDLNTVLGATAGGGTNPHPAGTTIWNVDAASFSQAGKIGLGDLDISEDELTLYAMNLNTRELLTIPLTSATVPVAPTTAASIGRYAVPTALPGATTGCTAADVRPFGIGVNDGLVYVGMVCTGQTTANSALVRAYVYSFNPATNTYSTAPVLEFPLTYTKGATAANFTFSPGPANKWNAWVDTYNGPTNGSYVYPQPMLSDITFDNGDMVVAFRDRLGDQAGPWTANPVVVTNNVEGIAAGDILRASPNTVTPNTWVLESAGKNGTNGRAFGPSAGAANGEGPGGGEFYYQDNYTTTHLETSNGGLAQVPGLADVVMSQMDPYDVRSAGITWNNDTSGGVSQRYEIYPGDGSNNPPASRIFEKANGLGDIEALCNAAPIEIGNRLWRDLNRNGIQDPGEPVVSGATVHIYATNGTTLLGTTTTDVNGQYLFTDANVTGGLAQSTNYKIKVDNATDFASGGPLFQWYPTQADVSSNTQDSRDSDGVAPSGSPYPVINYTTGKAGFNDHTLDFGFQSLRGTIGDQVFIDSNSNGTFDAGDNPLSNATVQLYLDSDGTAGFNAATDTLVSTATTGADGQYLFTNLPNGTYYVRVNGGVPTGYTQTTTFGGNTYATAVLSPTVQSVLTADFGFDASTTGKGSIGDYVWADYDNDGQQDAGEAGIGGVTVQLYLATSTTETLVATAVTTADGKYVFPNLDPTTASNAYRVAVVASTVPAAFNKTPTSNQPGSQSQPLKTGNITLTANQNITNMDFGFPPAAAGTLGTIGDTVYLDTNANGTQDTGETGITGVSLDLYQDTNGNGVIDTGESIIATAFTDANGKYLFSGLQISAAGVKYIVKVSDTNNQLVGLSATTTPSPYPVTLTTAVPNVLTADFGYVAKGTIGDLVWIDADGDQVFDSNELGLGGVTVTLTATGLPTQTVTTAPDGSYLFTNLAAGTYTVTVTPPTGYTNTTPVTRTVTLAANQSITTADFGFNITSCGGVTGNIFKDYVKPTTGPVATNSDGIKNNGETNLANVTIDLLDSAGNVIATTTTDASGNYTYPCVPAGSYSLVVSDRNGVVAGFQRTTAASVQTFTKASSTTTTTVGNIGYAPTPTAVSLVYFSTSEAKGQTTIEWATSSELNNLGFNLYFQPEKGQMVKLNDKLIASQSLSGRKTQSYSFSTKGLGAGKFYLEDVNTAGRAAQTGPFDSKQIFGEKPAPAKTVGKQPTPNAVSRPVDKFRLQERAYNLQTAQAGLYHLTYEYLTSQGIDFSGLEPSQLTLTGTEGQVSLKVVTASPKQFAAGDYIEWQAKAFHNIYTDYNSYVLSATAGGKRPASDGSAEGLADKVRPGATTVSSTVRVEKNEFFWESADARTDPWFWSYLTTYSPEQADHTFSFDLTNAASSSAASGIKIYLRGFLDDTALTPDHTVHAWVNGVDVGSVSFDGVNAGVINVAGSVAVQPTGNTLRLKLETLSGATRPYDIVLLDYAEMTYTQSSLPVYTAVQSVRAKSPELTIGNEKISYLIIAHPDFLSGVQPLVDLHKSEGQAVKVVSVNAIYDQYSKGIVDANAIRDYVVEVQKTLGTLQYVLLVGGDSTDPMNYYGKLAETQPGYQNSLPSFVPSLYTQDYYSYRAPSDNLYAPAGMGYAIGRLPAMTTAELSTMVNKTVLLANAARNHTLSNKATFVADNDSPEFAAMSDGLAATASLDSAKLYLGNGEADSLSRDQVRSGLLDRINAGSLLVNYAGHSGTNGWAAEMLLRDGDVMGLSNNSNPLIVAQWGCYNSYYASPISRSLGESWLVASGGAGFVIGGTGQSTNADQQELANRFYHNLFVEHMSLGAALTKAKADTLAANPSLIDVVNGFVILGDPALKL